MRVFQIILALWCLVVGLIYCESGDAARTAFWMGLAIFNWLGFVHLDIVDRMKK